MPIIWLERLLFFWSMVNYTVKWTTLSSPTPPDSDKNIEDFLNVWTIHIRQIVSSNFCLLPNGLHNQARGRY